MLLLQGHDTAVILSVVIWKDVKLKRIDLFKGYVKAMSLFAIQEIVKNFIPHLLGTSSLIHAWVGVNFCY